MRDLVDPKAGVWHKAVVVWIASKYIAEVTFQLVHLQSDFVILMDTVLLKVRQRANHSFDH